MTYQAEPLGPITPQEIEEYLEERNHLEHQIATIKNQAAAMISPLASRLNEINARDEQRAEVYARDEYRKDPKKKTHNFWNGTLKLTKAGGNVVLKDERQALEYAHRHSLEWLVSPPSIRLGEYQKYATQQMKTTGKMILV